MNRAPSTRALRRLAAVAVLALALVGTAAAGRGDAKKEITPADQARARAMLLRASDFEPGFKAMKSSDEDDFYCKALDESDLVLTGEAASPDFTRQALPVLSAGSGGQVYKTAGQSAESWRRGTSAAGFKCLQLAARQSAKAAGGTFVSFAKVPFPRVAPQTIAFRMVLRIQGIPAVADYVFVRNGRAQAVVYFLGAPVAYPQAEVKRLAKVVAGRVAKAMRGA